MQLDEHEGEGVPISTLIDVVFLLIIFFVVTASIQQDQLDHQIQLAKSKNFKIPDVQDKRTVVVNIRHTSDETPPVISVGGKHYTAEMVKRELQVARNRFGDSVPVVIRASADLKWRHIDEIQRMVTEAGLARVRHSAEALGPAQ